MTETVFTAPLIHWAWPWVGTGFAIVLIGFLFFSNQLRSDKSISRWKDMVWLSWLGVLGYLLHNIEEYGIDLQGTIFAFPKIFSQLMGAADGSNPAPWGFFTVTNITLVWIVLPVSAWLSRKYPAILSCIVSALFVNAFIHIMGTRAMGGYNSGLFTGLIFFLPFSLWVYGYALKHKSTWFGWGCIGWSLVVGVLTQIAILRGSINAYFAGILSPTAFVIIQAVNTALLLYLSYIVGRKYSKISNEI